MTRVYDPTRRPRRYRQTYRPRRDLIVFPVGMKPMSAAKFVVLIAWSIVWVFLVVAAATTMFP